MEDSVNIYSACKTFRLWGNVYLLPLKSSENSLVFEGSQACGVKTSGKKGVLLCKWEQSPVSIKVFENWKCFEIRWISWWWHYY